MNSFFSLEGPLIGALDKCGRVIVLSVLWLVFCLPLVTAGASASAFYYSITKTVMKERSSSGKEFIRAFKRSFKRSLPFSLIVEAAAAVLFIDILVWQGKDSTVALVSFNVCLVLFFVLISFAAFVFPVISRFIFDFKETLRFSAFLVFKHLPVSFGLFALTALVVAGVYAIPVSVIFLPGAACCAASVMIEKVFKKYIPDPDEGKEVWYDE